MDIKVRRLAIVAAEPEPEPVLPGAAGGAGAWPVAVRVASTFVFHNPAAMLTATDSNWDMVRAQSLMSLSFLSVA
ncbi:hypothetical protein ACLKA7_016974 [Drosophila subpalustris]